MSKAFDFLYQPLMLAKLKAYGVGDNSVKLLYSYFTDRYHTVKLGPVVSEWEVSRGCPQGLAFGPLLWNIYQNDLEYDIDVNLYMHADDHQLYAMCSDMEIVNANLTHSAKVLQSGILPTSLKEILISIESCCLVASLATILM